jgi:hypothetical protein
MVFDISTIISILLSTTLSVIGFLLWQQVRDLQRQIDESKKNIFINAAELDKIKLNYLNRFQDVKEHVSNNVLKIIERLTVLETKITTHLN